jgi:hypothetical protein
VNLQHDCATEGKCTSRPIAECQEREDTSRTRLVVQHSNSHRYILNTQGLHSIKHIRRALSPSLLEWWQLKVDPRIVHQQAIQKLASATASKALQAGARKAAKESFKSVMEGATTMVSESEPDRQPKKRQRTMHLKRTGPRTSKPGASTGQPSSLSTYAPPAANAPIADNTTMITSLSASEARPVPATASTPTTYSDFWAQFHSVT